MANVNLTFSAIQSLLHYYHRIEQHSSARAEKFYAEILGRINSLREDTLVHRGVSVHNDEGRELRYLIYKKHYLIYYEVMPDGNVEVYTLWHSSRGNRPLNRL